MPRPCASTLAVAFTLLCASAAMAQGAAVKEHGPPAERPHEHLKGPAVPLFHIVDAFYDKLLHRYPRPERYASYLKEELGIDPGSRAAETLTRAMLDVEQKRLHNRFDQTKVAAEARAFDRAQMEWLRQEVATLRSIWRKMLSDLEAAGYATEVLHRHLEERVRPAVSVMIIGERGADDFEQKQIVAAFEEEDK